MDTSKTYKREFERRKEIDISKAYEYMIENNLPIDIKTILDDTLSFKFIKASNDIVEYAKSEIENILDNVFSEKIKRYALLLEDYVVDVRAGTIYISLIDEGLSSIEKLYDIGLILIDNINIETKVNDKEKFIRFIKNKDLR